MPELPEVETVRRLLERVLVGKKIVEVEIPEDRIVLGGVAPEAFVNALQGRKVTKVGRKGKTWWLEFDAPPILLGHLGMAGWVREIGADTIRLREHGNAPFEDKEGKIKFLKMRLTTDDGKTVVFTDGRRLGRLWLEESPAKSAKLKALGPDWLTDPMTLAELGKILTKRKAPVKALLLDQKLFAGVGNWIADEVLYHAKIAPARLASSLTPEETKELITQIKKVLTIAVKAGADSKKYPKNWLFNVRWGGGKGHETHQGEELIRETIGGRTTAWVPSRQK